MGIALIGTSLLFGWLHIGYDSAQAVGAFMFSIVLIELRLLLGSLWLGIGLHVGFDALIFVALTLGGKENTGNASLWADFVNAGLWTVILFILLVYIWKKGRWVSWRKRLTASIQPTP